MNHKNMPLLGMAAFLMLFLSPVTRGSEIPTSETLNRLQAVFNTASSAFDRYQAMALRADLDGYGQVAALFRAVARGEQVLYTAFGDAIKELGAAPQTTADIPDVESTKQNLEKSIKDTEEFERDNAFAIHSKKAKAEGHPKIAKLFEYVKEAESQNLRSFKAASKNAEQMKAGGHGYYVCGLTGFTSAVIDPSHCAGGDWELVK